MPTEDRRVGKLLPDPVVPPDTVCFKINIPNAVAYRAAFLGQINVLGQALTWDHPTDGTVCEDCEVAAQLWRNAIYEATWAEECEEPVDCNEVANCIETSPAVQAAIAQQIANNPANNQTVYNTSYYGTPMTATQRNTVVSSTTDCEPNALFGSITQIVETLDRNNRDFLEIIEVGTNLSERAEKAIAAIPLLGSLPVDEIVGFIDKLIAEILENYEAQYTESLKDEYRCDLFCQFRDAAPCEVTFQALVEYWNNRLGTALEPINFFGALVQYFIQGTWAGSTVVDIMTLIQLSAWQEASNWTGISLRTLQTVGALGANSPDPDWGILCDCAEPPGCVGGEFINFTAGSFMFTPYVSRAAYVAGQGWTKAALPNTPTRIAIWRNVLPKPLKMKLITYGNTESVRIYRSASGTLTGPLLGQAVTTVANGDGTYTWTIPVLSAPAGDEILIDIGGGGDLAGKYLRSICWNYT